eukprot:Awhi_evm1s13932
MFVNAICFITFGFVASMATASSGDCLKTGVKYEGNRQLDYYWSDGAPTLQSCINLCDRRTECEFFSYRPKKGPSCILYGKGGLEESGASTYTSGSKNCPDVKPPPVTRPRPSTPGVNGVVTGHCMNGNGVRGEMVASDNSIHEVLSRIESSCSYGELQIASNVRLSSTLKIGNQLKGLTIVGQGVTREITGTYDGSQRTLIESTHQNGFKLTLEKLKFVGQGTSGGYLSGFRTNTSRKIKLYISEVEFTKFHQPVGVQGSAVYIARSDDIDTDSLSVTNNVNGDDFLPGWRDSRCDMKRVLYPSSNCNKKGKDCEVYYHGGSFHVAELSGSNNIKGLFKNNN